MNILLLKVAIRNYKKLCVYLIIITFLILMVNILMSFSYNVSYNIDNKILQKVSNRKIYVELYENQNETCLRKSIGKTYDYERIIKYFDPILISSNILGEIQLNKYIEDDLKIIKGRGLKYNNNNEIILPEKVKINGKVTETSHLLNKKILLQIKIGMYSEEHEFNVVGIYKQKAVSVINDCYTTDNIEYNSKNEKKYIVLLKNSNEKEKAINLLLKLKIKANNYDNSSNSEYNIYFKYKNIINMFTYISILILIILFYLIINKILREHNKILIIMKIYGYKKVTIYNNIIICFFTFINLAFIMSILLKKIIYNYILLIKASIIPSIISYLIIIQFYFIVLVLNYLKLQSKTISKLINNNYN